MSTALFCRSDFDLATAYLSAYSKQLLDFAVDNGYQVVDLYNDDPQRPARLTAFEPEIEKKPTVFVGAGHGNTTLFTGQDLELLIKKGVNDDVCNGVKTLLWSCLTGRELGISMVEKGCPEFYGYRCVSDDTVILTNNGWRGIDTIKETDKAFSLNLKTNKMEWTRIQKVYKYHYYQKIMYNFGNKRTNQLVTPLHRVLHVPEQSEKIKVVYARHAFKRHKTTNFKVPVSGEYVGSDYPIGDEELCLWAWILSEGSIRHIKGKNKGNKYGEKILRGDRVRIYQSTVHPMHLRRIRQLLQANNITWSESKYDSANGAPIIHFTFHKEGFSKIMPYWFLQFSQRQARLFLQEYRKGDGHKRNFMLTTAKPHDVEIITALAVIAGWLFRVVSHSSAGFKKVNNKEPSIIYDISIITDNLQNVSYLKPEKIINYHGRVWCITTDTGTFVSSRNGLVAITGNSDYTFIYHPQYENKPLEDPYARAFFDSGLATGYALLLGKAPQEVYQLTIDRYNYWWDYWMKQEDDFADDILTWLNWDRTNFVAITPGESYETPQTVGLDLPALIIPFGVAGAVLFLLSRV